MQSPLCVCCLLYEVFIELLTYEDWGIRNINIIAFCTFWTAFSNLLQLPSCPSHTFLPHLSPPKFYGRHLLPILSCVPIKIQFSSHCFHVPNTKLGFTDESLQLFFMTTFQCVFFYRKTMQEGPYSPLDCEAVACSGHTEWIQTWWARCSCWTMGTEIF